MKENHFGSRFVLLILLMSVSIKCNNDASKTTAVTQDSTNAVNYNINEIRSKRPKFKNCHEQIFDISVPERYFKVVVNSNKLCRISMVYFDNRLHKWQTLIWTGRGKNNKVLADTKFNQKVTLTSTIEDQPTFYMAISDDGGKTWKSLDMDLTYLTSCKINDPKNQNRAQLIVSNDFLNSTNTPSIAIIWQWNHLKRGLNGNGVAQSRDFSAFCPLLKEFPRSRESYP